jgi:hypothetical protein
MKRKTRVFLGFCLTVCMAAFSCVVSAPAREKPEEAEGIPLEEAIEQSAAELAGELPAGTRVAIVAFSSEHKNFSEYIMDELTGALVDRGR